jgi:nucleoside phosphorylase
MMSQPIQHIAILFAMYEEAEPLIKALMMEAVGPIHAQLPMHYYQVTQGNLHISVVLAGEDDRYGVDLVGTEPATLMAQLTLDNLVPDLLISAGTAGGFSAQGADIGTVYISAGQFVFHDHHVPLAGMDKAGVGYFPAVDASELCRALGLASGVISSGSSLEKLPRDVDVIQSTGAVAKDMESAAIAWVAMLHEVPCMAIKSVTNLVDEDNQSEAEFVSHFDTAVQSLTEQLCKVLTYLNDKAIKDNLIVAR